MKVLLLSAALLIIAFLGLSIKLLFNKKAEFKASCSAITPEMSEKGISCGCGGESC